jgi:putative acetyltransferase
MIDFTIHKIIEQGLALEEAKHLFIAYQQELNEDLCFQSFDTELENPLKKYGAPTGGLFIAYNNEMPIGCVALQQINATICEMKRLYVKPQYRKYKVGEALVQQIIIEAKNLGYAKIVLDTLIRLQAAIKLYEKHSFVHTTAYYENPLPNVVYMELSL